jgi:hypothetical protein
MIKKISSSYLAEMDPRHEIIMLKLIYMENFMKFGYLGHRLQRFESLVEIPYRNV